MKKALNGKVVIVTGATSGIGKAVAYEFASQGAIIILAARTVENLKVVCTDINASGGTAYYVKTDVRVVNECENLINQTLKFCGKIDILINNAGISMRARFEELDLIVIKELMDTNFYGAIYCTKYALPHILQQKGSIVNISSIAGLTPLPGRTGYCASKHALNGFFETLRLENRNNKLHILIVHPGFTNTNIRKSALNKFGLPQEFIPRIEEKMMTSEEVALKIRKATILRKEKILLTVKGKLSVWLFSHFPKNTEKLILRDFTKEPDSPG
ncbi:MAG: SDR family oxidoreductase [Bacteroidales bacterium]|nr:SDR family oxidoreductase [Bacteroidales bacterium]